MSGIAAIFDRAGTGISRDSLQRVTNALKLYGPDGSAMRINGPFGMAWTHHGGFRSYDKYERQPLLMGRWSCVFSGYLLYRAELADKLGISHDKLSSMPDSALFMAAWQKWEDAAGEHVEGEYAAIIGDGQQGCLFAIRSATGAPPLFFHETPDRFLIGSAPKVLFAHGDVPRILDEQKLADSMILNYQVNPGSYFKGITTVKSGRVLRVTEKGLSDTLYFDLRNAPDISYANDDDYVEAAQSLLNNAVAQYLQEPDIPAANLSAGLDSSTVVVTMIGQLAAQGMGDHQIDTYTHVPEPDWDGRAYGHLRFGDESPAVREFAKQYPQINPHFVDCAGEGLGQDVEKLFLLAEQPTRGINNLHWGMAIHRQVRASGKRWTMTGQSGNATLSFNARSLYAQWFREGKWFKLFRELAADKTPGLRFKGFYVRALAPNLPSFITRTIARRRGRAPNMGWEGYSAISPDYARKMQVEERAAEVGWDTGYAGFTNPREMMQHMLLNGNREEGAALRQAMQTISGVRGADPLGDPRIMMFCAGIPTEQYLRNGNHRYLIGRMMRGKLPNQYFTHKRGRQTADWHVKMTRDLDKYREEVAAIKDDPVLSERFDVARLERLLDTWPEKTPLSHKDHPDYAMAMLGLGRALTTAKFIKWVEGKNR